MSWFFVLYRSKWAPQDETPAGLQLHAEDEKQAQQQQQHCLDALPSTTALGAYTAPTYREALDAHFSTGA